MDFGIAGAGSEMASLLNRWQTLVGEACGSFSVYMGWVGMMPSGSMSDADWPDAWRRVGKVFVVREAAVALDPPSP